MTFLLRALSALILLVSLSAPGFAQLVPTQAEEPAEAVVGQVDAVIELLRDPAVIEALADRLAAEGEEATGEEAEAAEAEEEVQPSFGRRIASATTRIAEDTGEAVGNLATGLGRLPTILSRSAAAFDRDIMAQAVRELLFVVVVTYAVFLTLRFFGRRLDRRIGARAHDRNALLLLVFAVLASLKDIVVVLLAWAAGYGIVLAFSGQAGEVGEAQALYLNAFVVVEIAKIFVRMLLSPRQSELRLIRLPDRAARIVTRWLATCITILGYGLLLVVPMVNTTVSYLAGSALSSVISIGVVLSAIGMVLWYRRGVADWLTPHPDTARALTRLLAALWWIPVMIYLLFLLAIVATRPGGVLIPLLQATGIIIGVVVVAMIVFHLMTGAIARGISLPDSVRQRLPLLERRLNSFVPLVLKGLRILLIVVVAFVVADILGLVNFVGWVGSDVGGRVVGAAISVFLILIVAFALWLVFSSWVEFRLNPDFGKQPTARETTLLTLLRNAATIALLVITLMIVLSEVGVNIGPLLASAGVLGLAIGFGAQKMVQDIITGVFIQFENAINVGDVVSVGGITGAVEKLTVRSVSLRDVHGVFHIIPFSSVDLVSNFMREFSFYVADMGIAYREDIGEAKQAMHDAFDELRATTEEGRDILGDLEWFGLNSFGDSAIVVRARIKTLPGKQWAVGRAYNLILKRLFDERSIEIPYPHQTIYFGEDKNGKAPPMRVLAEATADVENPGHAEPKEVPHRAEPKVDMPDSDEAPDGEDAPR
ncbi:mechanosensitive ion channel domain-containing protein [Roseobacter sp. HKCCA0434]|uniref:mechanosensitive ion channel domain-containing protein n=1 Tax=Roseobacter sp. HKCCA0434 TaxID=3079297 RepID=UPI002905B13C|nr:mechanosensitive ion channel domain-containing protein [Roseobacter sp. HKCCA0434]